MKAEQYRAAWITEAGHETRGNLTTLDDATAQVVFLKKYRNAWLEGSSGKRIELESDKEKTS